MDQREQFEQGLQPFGNSGPFTPNQTLLDRMRYYHVPGVSIAVINDGVLAWAQGYGVGAESTSAPVQTNTRFAAASITKVAIGLAVLRLVQQGRLDLDTNVNDYLTSWKIPDSPHTQQSKVTLRGLLSHGAGLSTFGFWAYRPSQPIPTLIDILNGAPTVNSVPVRSARPPNTEWHYSSGGYCVIQQLLIDVCQQPFPDLMADLVLTPLEMHNSVVALTPLADQWAVTAHGHDATGAPIAERWRAHPELASAGLWSTASDIAKFAIAIQRAHAGDSNAYLSPELIGQMLTPQISNWGLGVALDGAGFALRFTHGGAALGFRSYLSAYCQRGQGAVILTNGERGDHLCIEVLHALARVYGWPDYSHYMDKLQL
jgi:CubicO group peptidase (beta-lactamase class C family)